MPDRATEDSARVTGQESVYFVDAGPPTRDDRVPASARTGGSQPAVFLLCLVALVVVLGFKNRDLFSRPIHEDGDYAANSIIIGDAKHFTLLVGNYSRLRFSHPGPAMFYVQALGEAVLHDTLGIVPTPFNGQALSVIVLNSAILAMVLMIVWSHTRSSLSTLAAFTIVLSFGAAYHGLLVAPWMPLVYFSPFLLLVVAAASVAVGRTGHLWCLALAGGLLVHGHVEFVLFVPVTAIAAVVGCVISRRRTVLRPATTPWRDLVTCGVILAMFVFPIVLNLLVHWPGELGKYITYARSNGAGGHTLREACAYMLQFWSRDQANWLALVPVLVGSAVAVAAGHPDVDVHRFLRACLAFVALETALLVFYAWHGIDDLREAYIGYFYWAGPVVVLVALSAGVITRVERRPGAAGIVVAAAMLLVLDAMQGNLLMNDYEGVAAMPEVLSTLRATQERPAQPLVLDIEHDAWPDAVGVLVAANRTGVHACMRDPFWEFMVTPDLVCSASDLNDGQWLRFAVPGSATEPPLVRMARSEVRIVARPEK